MKIMTHFSMYAPIKRTDAVEASQPLKKSTQVLSAE